MRVTNDNATLRNFKAWSGAVDTQDRILNEGKGEDFDSLIEELYPDGLGETALNDLLWFEEDWLFEMLGIEEDVEGEGE
jgi:hypothetical protein